jgi:hypothetical protein
MFSASEKDSLRQARFVILAVMAALVFLSQGCVLLQVRHSLPEHLLDLAQVENLPGIRAWGDVSSESLEQSAKESMKQEMAANHGKLEPEANFLALSGGGGDGAFGAGILCGWSEAGTRPRFKLVTGISTGALIAPFAFLGPEYDVKLKEVYTTISDKDIYAGYGLVKLLLSLGMSEGVASTEPLAELLERFIDENMLQEIADEHNQGRRLLVGTTQLDAQRLVIWNMGAIAASHHPDALRLFRQVIRASFSAPVAFNPVYIKIKAAGQDYDEMHVDGGVMVQVMLYGDALNLFVSRERIGTQAPQPRKLYIIRNAQVSPEYESIKRRLSHIGARAIGSLTKYQGVGDLYRIYLQAQRDEIDYNLAFIPADFKTKRASEFDPKYMNQEFELAYNLACSGYKWSKYPPGYEPANSQSTSSQRAQP